MEVTVKYFAVFREVAGFGEEVFPLPEGTCVRQLLGLLIQRHGGTFAAYLGNPATGGLKPGVLVFLNGKNVTSPGGLDSRINNGDMLLLLPAMKGGNVRRR